MSDRKTTRLIAVACPALVAGSTMGLLITASDPHGWVFTPIAWVVLLPSFYLLPVPFGGGVLAAMAITAWCWHLRRGAPRLPLRSRVLYAVLLALSVLYFAGFAAFGPAAETRLALALVVNALWLLASGTAALWSARRPGLLAVSVFYVLFFTGLFSLALPLGLGNRSSPVI